MHTQQRECLPLHIPYTHTHTHIHTQERECPTLGAILCSRCFLIWQETTCKLQAEAKTMVLDAGDSTPVGSRKTLRNAAKYIPSFPPPLASLKQPDVKAASMQSMSLKSANKAPPLDLTGVGANVASLKSVKKGANNLASLDSTKISAKLASVKSVRKGGEAA